MQPSQGPQVRRENTPSVSVEQAAKPSFEITVGDPHKVGDLTSSHIVYLVRTKVCYPELKALRRWIWEEEANRWIDYIESLPPTRIRSYSTV